MGTQSWPVTVVSVDVAAADSAEAVSVVANQSLSSQYFHVL